MHDASAMQETSLVTCAIVYTSFSLLTLHFQLPLLQVTSVNLLVNSVIHQLTTNESFAII